jgi:DNA-binding NarL/FixJ family response regulator
MKEDLRSIVILKADRLCAEALRQLTQRALPGADVAVVASIAAATERLGQVPCDLLVTGTGTRLSGDVLDFLAEHVVQGRRARLALVVTSHLEQRIVTALRGLAIQGVFDSGRDDPENYTRALHELAEGRRYWSPNVLDAFARTLASGGSLLRILTTAEQMVLAVVGDGSDDETAAGTLGLSAATVATVRRELHRKLGVQHRGELIRVAAQHGFVRFTPEGVLRPGLRLLSDAYNARRIRRNLAA